MKKLTFFMIIMFSTASVIYGQNPQWINYPSENYILALADNGNTIWVGTTGGLVRLDKTTGALVCYNMTNSALPSDWVISLAIEENGTKWIGT